MSMWRQALVVARRDFISIVATPTFLLFLLAPLIMIGFSAIGGLSASSLAETAGSRERVVVAVPAAEQAAFRIADQRLRRVAGGVGGPPDLVIVADPTPAQALDDYRRDADVLAILTGSAAAPAIAERKAKGFPGRYLATLAETVAREGTQRASAEAKASTPTFARLASTTTGRAAQSGLGYGAVFVIFLLTLLLAGQTVGMLAEEKGNKVIEILAAAAPLEAVFFGKLIGMLGVALLFIGFWGILIGGAGLVAASQFPAQAALLTVTPAIGWPLFLLLGLVYFLMAFLLLGAMFLGVGAQASTVREIQMLSLPITFFQVGMFALSTAAASAPDRTIATFAQLLPWSSPFAMAARGATDASLWPHALALGWQALWVAITISLSVRLFRAGVLRSGPGPGWRFWRRPAAMLSDS